MLPVLLCFITMHLDESNHSDCSAGAQAAGHMPLVTFIALIAMPGVLTKQFVNCVQLKNAMASLVVHDQQHGQPRKIQ